jgi:acetolactate synthase-1/3 small subunit
MAAVTEDIADLFRQLDDFGCILQYTRSGRIAVTRSFEEPVSDFLDEQERLGNDNIQ